MSEQTNIPTVEETNRRLSEPVRPASAVEDVTQPVGQEVTTPDVTPEDATSQALSCDQCDFVAKTANGLKSHARKHVVTLAEEDKVSSVESDSGEQDSK